jgi:hypothetical protein
MQCGGKDCSLVQTQAFFLSNSVSSLSSKYDKKTGHLLRTNDFLQTAAASSFEQSNGKY